MVEKGISARDLAAATSISYQPIYNIINGVTKNPSARIVKAIADYFGVSPSYLLGASDDKSRTYAGRRAALDRQLEAYATWPPPPGGVPVETKKMLYEKYLKAGLVSFRLEELDAEGVEMVYKILLKAEGEELANELQADSGADSGGT